MYSSLFSLLPDVLCLVTETKGIGARLCEAGRQYSLTALCSLCDTFPTYHEPCAVQIW